MPGMTRTLVRTLLVLTSLAGAQMDYSKAVTWNLPDAARVAFEKNHSLADYEISDALNPFYLRGDFDSDGKPDYAVLVVNKKTRKRGIAVVRSGATTPSVLGAGGTKLRVGAGEGAYLLDDFDWMDEWYVQTKQAAARDLGSDVAASMRGEGLVVAKSESASALIFWNGKAWVWKQMGD